jgi:hypothetical protein
MTRRRPNYYANRYNQWRIAGEIAVKTGAINPINPATGMPYDVYTTNDGGVHYSVIGQDYLRQLGIKINEI